MGLISLKIDLDRALKVSFLPRNAEQPPPPSHLSAVAGQAPASTLLIYKRFAAKTLNYVQSINKLTKLTQF